MTNKQREEIKLGLFLSCRIIKSSYDFDEVSKYDLDDMADYVIQKIDEAEKRVAREIKKEYLNPIHIVDTATAMKDKCNEYLEGEKQMNTKQREELPRWFLEVMANAHDDKTKQYDWHYIYSYVLKKIEEAYEEGCAHGSKCH